MYLTISAWWCLISLSNESSLYSGSFCAKWTFGLSFVCVEFRRSTSTHWSLLRFPRTTREMLASDSWFNPSLLNLLLLKLILSETKVRKKEGGERGVCNGARCPQLRTNGAWTSKHHIFKPITVITAPSQNGFCQGTPSPLRAALVKH